jgi:hypothetical protein
VCGANQQIGAQRQQMRAVTPCQIGKRRLPLQETTLIQRSATSAAGIEQTALAIGIEDWIAALRRRLFLDRVVHRHQRHLAVL